MSIFFENQYRSIDISIFGRSMYRFLPNPNIAMLHIILDQFLALNMNPAIFFRKSISIESTDNRYIDRSILIFDRSMYRFCQILEHSHVAYHSGSVLGPEHESGNIFFENRYRSIDILIFDRSMYISIFDKFSSHVAYRSGSVFGPEHESGIHFSKFDIVRLISRFSVHQYNRFLSSKFEFGIFLDISLFLRERGARSALQLHWLLLAIRETSLSS